MSNFEGIDIVLSIDNKRIAMPNNVSFTAEASVLEAKPMYVGKFWINASTGFHHESFKAPADLLDKEMNLMIVHLNSVDGLEVVLNKDIKVNSITDDDVCHFIVVEKSDK